MIEINGKQRIITLAAGAGFTNIRATIAAHVMVIKENGERSNKLDYLLKSTNFDPTQIFTTGVGEEIKIIGHGRSGIVGRPPNYNGVGYPDETAVASDDSGGGDIVVKVRNNGGTAIEVIVHESVSEL